MEKQTFLGLDVTPRWALWQEIAILKWQLKDTHEKLKDTYEKLEESRRYSLGPTLKNSADAITLGTVKNSLIDAERTIDAQTVEIADLRARLARYERPKDARGRFTKKTAAADTDIKATACDPTPCCAEPTPTLNPPTVTLCGLEWMSEPLSGYGGTERDGRYYYTQGEAIEAARRVGGGWRLPTKEEFCALAALGSTWVEAGPGGQPGRWFGGHHDTDHAGSLFFEASGGRGYMSGTLYNVGTYGSSWSSSPASPSSVYGSNLPFDSGGVHSEGYSNRASGFPVRLVREAKK